MIHVIDNFYIDADKYSYTVKKSTNRVDKEGNPVYEALGYPVTLEDALEFILKYRQKQVVEGKDLELKECLEMFKKENQKMKEVLDKIHGLEKI